MAVVEEVEEVVEVVEVEEVEEVEEVAGELVVDAVGTMPLFRGVVTNMLSFCCACWLAEERGEVTLARRAAA